MSRRVTLCIECVTLPPGTEFDAALFEAALAREIEARLGQPGGFGAARTVARLDAGSLGPAAPGAAPLAAALAQATIGGIGA